MKNNKAICSIKVKKMQQINQREAQLIREQAIEGLLLFDIEGRGSGSVLYYNVDGLLTLFDFLQTNTMHKRLFVIIMRSIAMALKGLQENYFSTSLIEWSLHATYIDPSSLRVYLMYIPVEPYEAHGNLKDFLLHFAASCVFAPGENAEYVQTLLRDVKKQITYTVHMLDAFCDAVSNELLAELQEDRSIPQNPSCRPALWLEDMTDGDTIVITRLPFRIGKMDGVNDYRISDNAVSRKHVDIQIESGKYYVTDLGSTNGTFLNNKRIQPGTKEELRDGVHLKLADKEFIFHIDRSAEECIRNS